MKVRNLARWGRSRLIAGPARVRWREARGPEHSSRVGRSHLRCLGQHFGETALQLVESYQEPDFRAVVV